MSNKDKDHNANDSSIYTAHEWYTFTPDNKTINSGNDPGDEQGNRSGFFGRINEYFFKNKITT